MLVLGLETTCDETAAAVIRRGSDGKGEILANEIASQTEAHAAYGGVVPEIAARAHVEILDGLIERAMKTAGLEFSQLACIASAAGPGLIGGVIVGLTTAKTLSLVTGKPMIAVNHLEAHALTPRLTDNVPFPYLLLLVSGGHTQLVAVLGVGEYRRIGSTIDDAIGEAFDKVAKMLSLPYPGGPEVEKEAQRGNPERFDLPRPLLGRPQPDFSLSGLKTAVRIAADAIAPLSVNRCRRSLRLVPGGGGRHDRRPCACRPAPIPRAAWHAFGAGGRGRRRVEPVDQAARSSVSRQAPAFASWCRRQSFARIMAR